MRITNTKAMSSLPHLKSASAQNLSQDSARQTSVYEKLNPDFRAQMVIDQCSARIRQTQGNHGTMAAYMRTEVAAWRLLWVGVGSTRPGGRMEREMADIALTLFILGPNIDRQTLETEHPPRPSSTRVGNGRRRGHVNLAMWDIPLPSAGTPTPSTTTFTRNPRAKNRSSVATPKLSDSTQGPVTRTPEGRFSLCACRSA